MVGTRRAARLLLVLDENVGLAEAIEILLDLSQLGLHFFPRAALGRLLQVPRSGALELLLEAAQQRLLLALCEQSDAALRSRILGHLLVQGEHVSALRIQRRRHRLQESRDPPETAPCTRGVLPDIREPPGSCEYLGDLGSERGERSPLRLGQLTSVPRALRRRRCRRSRSSRPLWRRRARWRGQAPGREAPGRANRPVYHAAARRRVCQRVLVFGRLRSVRVRCVALAHEVVRRPGDDTLDATCLDLLPLLAVYHLHVVRKRVVAVALINSTSNIVAPCVFYATPVVPLAHA
mmetsp:Transcript_92706/g.299936  ORF Transcript_92706/g.299936 Transcript_92706/m.299936 type:complete len:293 (-) Transcript_92706:56-934(-)